MQTIQPISPQREPAPEIYSPVRAVPPGTSAGHDGAENASQEIKSGFRAMRVPRIEDLPYATSPPVQWVYERSHGVAAGAYTWADAPGAMVFSRPVLPNVVYYIRNFSLSADISENDFLNNVSVSPLFQIYFSLDPNNVLLREPLIMNKYYDQFDFRYMLMTQKDGDTLLGAFLSGTINQGPSLIGKATIRLKVAISAQEIADQYFVDAFLKGYPPPT